MCGDVMTCAGTCSQAQSHEPPQKLEELRQLKRGFPGFLLSTKVNKNLSVFRSEAIRLSLNDVRVRFDCL